MKNELSVSEFDYELREKLKNIEAISNINLSFVSADDDIAFTDHYNLTVTFDSGNNLKLDTNYFTSEMIEDIYNLCLESIARQDATQFPDAMRDALEKLLTSEKEPSIKDIKKLRESFKGVSNDK